MWGEVQLVRNFYSCETAVWPECGKSTIIETGPGCFDLTSLWLGTENSGGLEDVGFKKGYPLFCGGMADLTGDVSSINVP